MDSHSKISVTNQKEQDEKLLAELAREEARNKEALRMVKEKELQALAARDRAADSQRRMQDMVVKYEEMKQKLEWTRLTLEHTASQINQNDIKRAQQIQATVARLKEKAEHCSGILKKKREREEKSASDIISGNDTNLDIIVPVPMDDGGSLSEAEKMLLLMCQKEAAANQTENENKEETTKESDMQMQEINQTTPSSLNQEDSYDDTSLTEAEKMLLLVCQQEKSVNNEEPQDVKGLIEEEQSLQIAVEESIKDISEKETSSNSAKENTIPDPEGANVDIEEKPKLDHEDNNNDLSKECQATNPAVINVDALDTIENVEPKASPPVVKMENTEAPQDFDLKEVTKDLKETVNNIEAKCAGVREELGQMAMSEQYMRTKQAQLLAKRREKEADLALEVASKKEQEAQDMRRKVANMMKLLEERRNKLKVTENVLEKRTNVVDKVNKVLDSKLRKADFVQKQRDECLAFDISHRNSKPEKQETNNTEQTDIEELDVEKSNNIEPEPEKEVKDDKM